MRYKCIFSHNSFLCKLTLTKTKHAITINCNSSEARKIREQIHKLYWSSWSKQKKNGDSVLIYSGRTPPKNKSPCLTNPSFKIFEKFTHTAPLQKTRSRTNTMYNHIIKTWSTTESKINKVLTFNLKFTNSIISIPPISFWFM